MSLPGVILVGIVFLVCVLAVSFHYMGYFGAWYVFLFRLIPIFRNISASFRNEPSLYQDEFVLIPD